ncbi:hypothetical protein B4145_4545 [Bacillus subtilis]|uniref:Uncharacterized protein n=1 Tax=Bacillus subtilis subsp. subtilis TaxID=135461 RepID=A0ABD3ZZ90_BACIU|nr:hypothetical protein B4067_4661 [Bacillus subtilis subsp. subtilis]KIN42403.1 hypothetical protein B4070_4275 [Bacillus subtilis]KIN59303.1 hypothetical protein B4145_4545 [Bacillus subtilis]
MKALLREIGFIVFISLIQGLSVGVAAYIILTFWEVAK